MLCGASSSQCSPSLSSVLAPQEPLTAFAAQHTDGFAAIDMTDLLCPDGASMLGDRPLTVTG
jgi:hypothetical protein